MIKKITTNKRALFDYLILDRHIAGIQLQGSEVKSVMGGKVSVSQAFCTIENDSIFICDMDIEPNKESGKIDNHERLRVRRLLMKKKEIIKLSNSITQKGLTIVPILLFVSDFGKIKLEIGLTKGKKLYDKKISVKLKDLDRDLKRNLI